MTATTAPTSDLEITDHGSGLRGPLLGVNGHERRGADDPRPDHHARLGILNQAEQRGGASSHAAAEAQRAERAAAHRLHVREMKAAVAARLRMPAVGATA
jgi:hypothetical protein